MGFPRPSIAWQKDGQKVDRNITFNFEPTLVARENEIFDFVIDSLMEILLKLF